jgi:hypothetical protein
VRHDNGNDDSSDSDIEDELVEIEDMVLKMKMNNYIASIAYVFLWWELRILIMTTISSDSCKVIGMMDAGLHQEDSA